MGYQTLYRKYRPQRFADLVGQVHVRRTLQNAMATGKLAHAYLFCGPRGTGKTTTARILAKALNCETLAAARAADPALTPDKYEPCNECPSCLDITRGVSFDVLEVDAATHRGIDDIRQIGEQSQQAATDPSRHRVFIIDEVHQLSRDGASAFLKTLEEPPPNVVFVLATTDPERMISTILSRCQRFDFRPVALAELTELLARVCESEGIDADAAALEALARRAHGGVRDALSALEQARALCDDHIEAGDVAQLFGGLDTEDLALAFDAVVSGDAAAALRHVDVLVRRGVDVRTLLRELIEWARQVFLAAAAPDARDLVDLGDDAYERAAAQAKALGAAGASRALTRLGEALVGLPQSLNPRIDVETALVALTLDRPGRGDADRRVSAVDVPTSAPEAAVPGRGDADRRVSAVDVPTSAPEAAAPGRGDADRRVGAVDVPTSAPEAAAPAVATPASTGDLDLGSVEARWPELLATLKQQFGPRLLAYYHGSVPVAVEGDTVTVAFAAEFHRTNATKAQDEFAT
ncbi:MAG: DNA polymerase III subunit gamma/tau, partial [Acidimicrobiia bacterium]|nr:DNA polymerase III subunit gamma/tau [Acidimicrobiia bacterium]